MNETMRCPTCHQVPTIKIDDDFKVVFSCPEHGFTAQGDSLDQTRVHWNLLVYFLGKVA